MSRIFTYDLGVNINDYAIINSDNYLGVINSLHDCVGVIIDRKESKVLMHLNINKDKYEECLESVFSLSDDDILSATIYEGFEDGKDTINDLISIFDKLAIPYTVKSSFLQDGFMEGSIGYDYDEDCLIGLDLKEGEIRVLDQEEIESLSNVKRL